MQDRTLQGENSHKKGTRTTLALNSVSTQNTRGGWGWLRQGSRADDSSLSNNSRSHHILEWPLFTSRHRADSSLGRDSPAEQATLRGRGCRDSRGCRRSQEPVPCREGSRSLQRGTLEVLAGPGQSSVRPDETTMGSPADRPASCTGLRDTGPPEASVQRRCQTPALGRQPRKAQPQEQGHSTS